MSRGGVDTFALVINYLDERWTPRHVIVGLFEVSKTTSNTMTLQLQTLSENFGLICRVIAFVEDEDNNLASMAITSWPIIDCDSLKLLCIYEDICFGHVMSKVSQYGTNDDQVSMGLILVILKEVQISLHKKITWTKNSRKKR